MFGKVKLIIFVAIVLIVFNMTKSPCLASTASTIPNVSREMLKSDFWIEKLAGPDELLMSQKEIAAFNKDIIQKLPETIYDLTNYPSSLTKDELTKLVTKRPFPEEDRFINDKKVDLSYYEMLKIQMNLPGIEEINQVYYALTIRRTNIRTFPTGDVSLSEPNDWEFDMFQETAVGASEPVLVLHHSLDGQWYFVQVNNYCGWMPTSDLALAKNKANWLDYVNAGRFLVVTDNRLRLGFNMYSPELSELELTMGTKLPLADEIPKTVDNQSVAGNYVVKLPVRDSDGQLNIKLALVPVVSDVSEGYLSYTRANIIKQAYKVLGERYGWGGMFNGRDCSAFAMDVYKCFGFGLPRNGDEQEQAAGEVVKFDSLNTEQRYALIDTLLPGATLHTPTHEMIYLGKHEGRYYVIHDVTSLGDTSNRNPDGSLGRLVLNEVVITDLSLPRRNGILLIDSLTSGKQIEYQKEPDLYNYNVSIYVNDILVNFPDQRPFIDSLTSRVYVPVRFVSEEMGAKVKWVNEDRKIVMEKADKKIAFVIGDKTVDVNGKNYTLEAAITIVNDRTMAPLRFISEVLGAEVQWTASDDGGRVDIKND